MYGAKIGIECENTAFNEKILIEKIPLYIVAQHCIGVRGEEGYNFSTNEADFTVLQ